jgi:hypothetical protein
MLELEKDVGYRRENDRLVCLDFGSEREYANCTSDSGG